MPRTEHKQRRNHHRVGGWTIRCAKSEHLQSFCQVASGVDSGSSQCQGTAGATGLSIVRQARPDARQASERCNFYSSTVVGLTMVEETRDSSSFSPEPSEPPTFMNKSCKSFKNITSYRWMDGWMDGWTDGWLAPDGSIVGGCHQSLEVCWYLTPKKWLEEMSQDSSL